MSAAPGIATASTGGSWRWLAQAFTLELRKTFAYRLAFWLQAGLNTLVEVGVAYFLWRAVYQTRGVHEIQGFSLLGMTYYYIFASLGGRIMRGTTGDGGTISEEIYTGGLTRFLLYPVSIFGFKIAENLAGQLLRALQLFAALGIAWLALGHPGDQQITWTTLLSGTLAAILAGFVHFQLSLILEMVAFWQDTVWNLMVMLKFIINLLGGGFIPLALFPAWGQSLVRFTPFPLLIDFPTRCYLGQVDAREWLMSALLLAGWTALLSLVARLIWRRGLKQYTGVGI